MDLFGRRFECDAVVTVWASRSRVSMHLEECGHADSTFDLMCPSCVLHDGIVEFQVVENVFKKMPVDLPDS